MSSRFGPGKRLLVRLCQLVMRLLRMLCGRLMITLLVVLRCRFMRLCSVVMEF